MTRITPEICSAEKGQFRDAAQGPSALEMVLDPILRYTARSGHHDRDLAVNCVRNKAIVRDLDEFIGRHRYA